MTDALSGLGLAPASTDEPGTAEVEAPEAPVSENAPVPVAAEPANSEPEIVVPEGAQNPDAVRNAIAAERRAAREANARARELEAELRQQQESALPLEQRISTAESKASEAELRATRIEIGVSKGLTIAQCKRLSGSTVEEIEADATAFAAELGSRPAVPAPTPETGAGYQEPPPATKPKPEAAHNEFVLALLGKQ